MREKDPVKGMSAADEWDAGADSVSTAQPMLSYSLIINHFIILHS